MSNKELTARILKGHIQCIYCSPEHFSRVPEDKQKYVSGDGCLGCSGKKWVHKSHHEKLVDNMTRYSWNKGWDLACH